MMTWHQLPDFSLHQTPARDDPVCSVALPDFENDAFHTVFPGR